MEPAKQPCGDSSARQHIHAAKQQARLQEGQDLDLQLGHLYCGCQARSGMAGYQTTIIHSPARTWAGSSQSQNALKKTSLEKTTSLDLKKLIPSSLPAWPKLRPMCWGGLAVLSEHATSTSQEAKRTCSWSHSGQWMTEAQRLKHRLDSKWRRHFRPQRGGGGFCQGCPRESITSSPDLPLLLRGKRSRACMLPNIQRCQTVVETGLSAFSTRRLTRVWFWSLPCPLKS